MNWLADVRYAARRLVARPAYSVLAVLTLALGVGGTARRLRNRATAHRRRSAICERAHGRQLLDARLVDGRRIPLHARQVHRLQRGRRLPAARRRRCAMATRLRVSCPAFKSPRSSSTSSAHARCSAVPFTKGDDVRGAAPVAMISYGLYQELGGTPDIVGKQMMLNGVSQTIVGVMPRRFWFPSPDIRIWSVNALDPEGRNGSYALVGLPARGFDVHRMTAPLAQITRTLGERFHYSPQADKTQNAKITPLRDELLGSMRPARDRDVREHESHPPDRVRERRRAHARAGRRTRDGAGGARRARRDARTHHAAARRSRRS